MERNDFKPKLPGNPLYSTLSADLRATDVVRKELKDLRSDILSFRASPTDAVKWYYGQDPLKEFEAMRQVAAEVIGPAAALLTMQGGRFDRKVHEAAAAI